MPKPYSYDLRQKVIQAIELVGLKKSEASQLFNISRNTLDSWVKRLSVTGDFQALPNQPPGNGHTARTFTVSRVLPTTQPMPEIPYHQAVADLLSSPLESCSRYSGQLVAEVRSHPLIAALHAAFSYHHPICLSPDMIWLTLTQGLATHINVNAEQLRHHFVQHEGKLKIVVRRDAFVKGSPENPWSEVFTEFSQEIRKHIGEAHSLIVADFSTTGSIERAASEVVLLDAMQSYFKYELHTLCGIPTITLEGTVEDWRSIAQRVEEFARFDLEWWVKAVRPILKQFVAASAGRVDRKFWDSIYKYQGAAGSGSPYITGWITKLFPYLVNSNAKYQKYYHGKITQPLYQRNPWLDSKPKRRGPARADFPNLPSKVPFKWIYLGTPYDMEFIAGIIGVSQDQKSLCLRPEIGWVVREAGVTCGSSTNSAKAL